MRKYKTPQEKFWAGKFGDDYLERNSSISLRRSKFTFYSKVAKNLSGIHSVIEFGSNVGLNLLAINNIFPRAELSAIEINKKAISELEKRKIIKVYPISIFDFSPDYKRDLVLISGVLIHTNPKMLDKVYDLLYQTASKYILIVEYYNPTPISVPYRGHKNRLYKRDFAGEMLNKFKKLHLLNYGFIYHRENKHYGDSTWFLLEKK